MKNILSAFLLFLMSAGLFAQTAVTHKNNALLPGDSSVYREVQFVDPGNAGPNQIWDYSKLQYIGKNSVSSIRTATGQKDAGTGDYNVVASESGYDYFLKSSETSLEERGYVNNGQNLSLVYSDPVLKMKYPFFYGDQYTDPFTAVAFYNEQTRVEFSGNYTMAADAYGTLILPDMIIKNALRLKTVKKGLQISQCGSTEINIVKYCWYAQGYRYPVMNVSITESRYRGETPGITKSAFINTMQPNSDGTAAGTNDQGKQVENQDVSVILFPNPFEEKLTFNYFLRKQLPVSAELYDMSGKVSMRLFKNQVQPEGLHTGEIDGIQLGLAPGVYYIRFTFDKQVVVNKIVKI